MVKKTIIMLIVIFCLILNASFTVGCNDEKTETSEHEEEQEPDYERAEYHKKVFKRNGIFIAGSSDIGLWKEPNEVENEDVGLTVTIKKSDYPCFLGYTRDVEFSAQGINFGVHYYKDNHMWSISRELEIDTRHSDVRLGFEWGNDGRVVALDEIPNRKCYHDSSEPFEEENKNNKNEVDEEEDNEGVEDDDSDGKNPIYENSHQFQRNIGNSQQPLGVFQVKTSIEIFEESQENNNTDGLVVDAGIDWNEPLYYTGSLKYASITFNGYGVSVYKQGPDAGMNQHSSIKIKGRHMNAELKKGFDTGVYPNVYV
jgi:hypothetical protein